MMHNELKEYINSHKLCEQNDRILIAVSGGIDSVVMLDLLYHQGFECGIAHCNFNLRGDESDQDEQFVKALAAQYDLPFYSTRFETKQYAGENHISIQMAARALRYEWFEKTRQENDYDLVAVAHNSDDVVESFLNNMARGTGLRGLTGIKPKVNNIIRPILFASRDRINQYCTQNKLKYREDSSNASVKYSRNLLRHKIIPLFESINPSFRQTIADDAARLTDSLFIYEDAIQRVRKSLINSDQDKQTISINELNKLSPINTWLFELFRVYNVTNQHLTEIISILNNIPGKQVLTPTHRIVRDREMLIITPRFSKDTHQYYIDEDTLSVKQPLNLTFQKKAIKSLPVFKDDNTEACLDYDKLEFPLLLRKWQHGDYFMPLGMQGLKKLSDFFIDNKLSLVDKENVWLLLSSGKIAWIIGHRIDERFKVTRQTNTIFKVEIFMNK